MSSKRKFSELEDSDEDEPTLGHRALPVANLPADFNGVPQNGLEYLFTVRRDARSLPHVTRVPNPYEVIKEEPVQLSMQDLLAKPAHPSLPSQEWRDTFLRRFKNFRANCTQPTIHIDMPASHKIMPNMKDRDAWWAFLRGRPESEWNPPKKVKPQNARNQKSHDHYGGMRGFRSEYEVPMSEDTPGGGPNREASHVNDEREVEQAITIDPAESLPTPSGTPAPPDRPVTSSGSQVRLASKSGEPEPTPMLMRHVDHRYALHLLMYFAYWLDQYLQEPTPRVCKITETHARWMFVLLSRVDEFITADEQSTLRNLARDCMSLVKERMQESAAAEDGLVEEPSVMGISSCWMVVTAVTGVWGQKDLWIDAEDMLSKVVV